MKKINQYSKTKYIKNVAIYREEIDELIQLMMDKDLAVTFKDKDCQFDSINELESHRGSYPKILRIEGEVEGNNCSDYISVEFNTKALFPPVTIHAVGVGAPRELLYEINELFEQRVGFKRIIANS